MLAPSRSKTAVGTAVVTSILVIRVMSMSKKVKEAVCVLVFRAAVNGAVIDPGDDITWRSQHLIYVIRRYNRIIV